MKYYLPAGILALSVSSSPKTISAIAKDIVKEARIDPYGQVTSDDSETVHGNDIKITWQLDGDENEGDSSDSSDDDESDTTDDNDDEDTDEEKVDLLPPGKCGLYLAPSSLPGAGIGLYSGTRIPYDYSINEYIGGTFPGYDDDRHPPLWNDLYIPIADKYKALPYRGQQRFPSWLGYIWPNEFGG